MFNKEIHREKKKGGNREQKQKHIDFQCWQSKVSKDDTYTQPPRNHSPSNLIRDKELNDSLWN